MVSQKQNKKPWMNLKEKAYHKAVDRVVIETLPYRSTMSNVEVNKLVDKYYEEELDKAKQFLENSKAGIII